MKTTVPRNIKNIALDWLDCRYIMDFSDHSVVRNPPANKRDKVSISGPGRAPGRRNDNPLQYSCLRNPMDRGALQAQSMGLQRVEHDWTTNTFTFHFQYPLGSPCCHKWRDFILFLQLSSNPLYISLFIYSAIDGHLGASISWLL